MGRTWPNLESDPVTTPGYYWNARLRKLARLSMGERLPRHVGPWEFLAGEHEGSSSEVTRRIFDRYPALDVNDFTYTTTTPLARRLPIGDDPPGTGARSARERLAMGQGAFYVLAGLWPIVNLPSFEAVTGRKPEGWLVKAVGALVTVVGAALVQGGRRRRVTPELAFIGAGAAGALGGIAGWYALRRRISPVYFLDALVEGGLVAGWMRTARRATP